MSDNGDWYCRNCGYLSASRVTHAETCDTCHNPVEWHTVEEAREFDKIIQERKELLDFITIIAQDGNHKHFDEFGGRSSCIRNPKEEKYSRCQLIEMARNLVKKVKYGCSVPG